MKHKLFCAIIMFSAIILPHLAIAENINTIFEKDKLYDIYCKDLNSINIYIVNHVVIVNTINFSGHDFLVIKKVNPDFMEKKSNSGYILFDKIIAILPSNESFELNEIRGVTK